MTCAVSLCHGILVTPAVGPWPTCSAGEGADHVCGLRSLATGDLGGISPSGELMKGRMPRVQGRAALGQSEAADLKFSFR
jgi:hypothetical protein